MKLVKLFSIFTILLALSSVGSLTTGCGISGVGDEIVDDNLNPTDDNSLGGSDDGSTTGGDTAGNDDSSSSDSSPSSSGGSDDGSTTGSSSDDSSSSSSGGSTGEGNAIPGQASIPVILSYDIPSIDEADVYYSTPTEDDVTADTGTQGAIENCDDDADGDNDECTVVMSTGEITEATAMLYNQSPLSPPLKVRGGWGELFASLPRALPSVVKSLFTTKSAHADYATELSEICSREGVKCCQGAIAADGSFECYNNFGDATIYTYVVKADIDDTLLWSTAPYIDTPNNHVKWHDGSDYELRTDGTHLFAITEPNDGTDNDVVYMQNDGTTWRVTPNASASYSAGDYVFDTENLWREFGGTETIDGEKLGYDSGNQLMAVMDPTNGVTAYYLMSSGSASLTTMTTTFPDTVTGFTQIKYSYNSSLSSNALMVGVIESTSSEAYVYYALDGTSYDFLWPTTSNAIQFTRSTDGLSVTKTTDFDSDSQGNFYILFECDTTLCTSTQRRIRASDGTNMWGGLRTLRFTSSSHTDNNPFTQLMIYYEDTSSNEVRLALLDSENSMLWNITADTSARTITDGLDSTNGLSITSGAVAMALNSDGDRLYIAGSTEISVVALKNSGGSVITPTLVATVNIADATGLSLKSFASSLSPSSIIVQDDTIFIGATGIKSALTIDVADITEDTSVIPDTDPGSTTTGGTTSGGWNNILDLLNRNGRITR